MESCTAYRDVECVCVVCVYMYPIMCLWWGRNFQDAWEMHDVAWESGRILEWVSCLMCVSWQVCVRWKLKLFLMPCYTLQGHTTLPMGHHMPKLYASIIAEKYVRTIYHVMGGEHIEYCTYIFEKHINVCFLGHTFTHGYLTLTG